MVTPVLILVRYPAEDSLGEAVKYLQAATIYQIPALIHALQVWISSKLNMNNIFGTMRVAQGLLFLVYHQA